MGINYIIRIMHNYPQNNTFLYHNLKLHKMIKMHSKYDNMHTNRIFNALNSINNHLNSCINCILSRILNKELEEKRGKRGRLIMRGRGTHEGQRRIAGE